MQTNPFLLYGANGYTGELIARYASMYNLQPILAGRREEALKPLAQKLNLPYKVIDLDDAVALQAALREVKVVVHAAGPFLYTAKQMAEACLQTGTHYLDINGDITVFEMLKRYDDAAKRVGIMMMSGAGFDVVPTDCLALFLKKQLPDAVKLQLAFATLGGGISHGTGMSMIDRLGEGGAIRKGGKIIRVPLGHLGMWIDFGPKKLFVMSIPWGDISTAWFTTGIPDIETYTGIKPTIYRLLKAQGFFNWLLRTSFVRGIIRKKMSRRPAGPSDEQREKAIGFVWGQVSNAAGKTVTARLTGSEGYTITLHGCLLIAQKILQGNFNTGYQTPASAYGEDLVLEIPGMKRELINQERS
ncbi:MAG: Saccharopine dehydrogenase [Chitinophagaceae bacterium]|nr:Saccharopine dehydrogenase [Chitinophagaceae bacterium]